ncbi:sensor histidine kinase [Tuberibacillus calidus]|uniref:sensor histidine kinase n=1 Tax=Tuberibacillus calidus TaxID=340097 RepID=UPI00040B41AA|nr:histidine kinase [Tuberibacillus calidus]
MISIRMKIIIYSGILILLLNGISFFLYQSSQKAVNQYNVILQRFFLLNEVSQSTDEAYKGLNAYLIERDKKDLERYEKALRDLNAEMPLLKEKINQADLTVQNYEHLIESFREACSIVMRAYQEQDLDVYSSHLIEAEKISGYIQETTLKLIQKELTNYQTFYHEMEEKHQYFRSMSLSIFIASLLFGLLFALWFSKGMTRPITHLSLAAKEISQGNFNGKDVPVTTNDELRLLTQTFNHMRQSIRELVKEMKKKSELDQLLKEMELKSLQNQINPHFLFNTLNVVSKMAYIEGAEKTSDLIISIGTLLRYNLGNLDKPVTLEDEVNVVKEYFFIQRTRFGDRVNFTSEIDPDCLHLPVPVLTLQPIVENAFIHGIESIEEKASLTLRVYRKEELVIVEVEDSGVGMDQETVRKLLQKQHEEVPLFSGHKGHSTGLGMENVIKRLQLFYERKNVIDIQSRPGEGSIVKLLLPANFAKEVQHV